MGVDDPESSILRSNSSHRAYPKIDPLASCKKDTKSAKSGHSLNPQILTANTPLPHLEHFPPHHSPFPILIDRDFRLFDARCAQSLTYVRAGEVRVEKNVPQAKLNVPLLPLSATKHRERRGSQKGIADIARSADLLGQSGAGIAVDVGFSDTTQVPTTLLGALIVQDRGSCFPAVWASL